MAVLPALLYPGSQATEAGGAGDVINKEHRMEVTVVVLHHGLPKTLLSRRVPQLELMVRKGNKKQKGFSTEENVAGREHNKEEANENGTHTREKKSCVEIPRMRQKHRHTPTHTQ